MHSEQHQDCLGKLKKCLRNANTKTSTLLFRTLKFKTSWFLFVSKNLQVKKKRKTLLQDHVWRSSICSSYTSCSSTHAPPHPYLAAWPRCAGLSVRVSGWFWGGRGPSRTAPAGSASSCRVKRADSRALEAPTASALTPETGPSPGDRAPPDCECRSWQRRERRSGQGRSSWY